MSEPDASTDDDLLKVVLAVSSGPDSDDEEVERSTRQLRTELIELDVDSVALARSEMPVPEGTKAADPVTVGAIIVALSAANGVLTSLVGLLEDWLGRHSADHKITVIIDGDTLELDDATTTQQMALVTHFLERHTPQS